MMKRFRTVTFLLIACLCFTGTMRAQETLLQEIMDSLKVIANLPSFSVAILENGEVVFAKAIGFADIERQIPATTETQYRLASVSKLLTVSGLAKLVEDEKISFDIEIAKLLPDFPQIEGITPKLLAGHLSGISHYQPADKMNRSKHYRSMEESLNVFKDSPRGGLPGEQYAYSTHGYTLLSAVVEKAADQPFVSYLEEHLFIPLDMKLASHDNRIDLSPNMSSLYRGGSNLIQAPEDPSYKWGGGGMIGTPTDLVKLAQGYFSGFFPPEIIDEMWTSQKLSDGEETGVGIGWRIGEDFDGKKIIHHAGAMGGARSVLLLYPDEKTAIASTTNSTWTSMVELNASMLMEAFHSHIPKGKIKEGKYAYNGNHWDGKTEGWLIVKGNRASISTPEPMSNWFGDKSVAQMPIFYLRDDLWAMVTPYGIAPLTLDAKDNVVKGKFWIRDDRVWEFTGTEP